MDNPEIQQVLDFWFSDSEQGSPKIDSRMERWFGGSEELDAEIADRFGGLVEQASSGELDHWAATPDGRLALIILLDQFRRNIYRGSAEAFACDLKALKLSVEGAMNADHKSLTAVQRIFFFMPLEHSESIKIQEKSVRIFNALAEGVSETLHETFLTFAHFAELHRDIIAEFGRFPHRNQFLGRSNTPEEEAYLASSDSVLK